MKTKFTCPRCKKVDYEDVGEPELIESISYCTPCLEYCYDNRIILPDLARDYCGDVYKKRRNKEKTI